MAGPMRIIAVIVVSCLLTSHADACRELRPNISVASSVVLDGGCFAVTIPQRFSKGHTAQVSVYKAGKTTPEYSFDWNDRDRIFIECGKLDAKTSGDVVVRVIDSQRKFRPTDKDSGVEFYLGGKLVKSYPALALANSPKGYLATECGYRLVFKAAFSDQANDGTPGDLVFRAETADRQIDFHPVTGEIIRTGKIEEKAPSALQTMFAPENK